MPAFPRMPQPQLYNRLHCNPAIVYQVNTHRYDMQKCTLSYTFDSTTANKITSKFFCQSWFPTSRSPPHKVNLQALIVSWFWDKMLRWRSSCSCRWKWRPSIMITWWSWRIMSLWGWHWPWRSTATETRRRISGISWWWNWSVIHWRWKWAKPLRSVWVSLCLPSTTICCWVVRSHVYPGQTINRWKVGKYFASSLEIRRIQKWISIDKKRTIVSI